MRAHRSYQQHPRLGAFLVALAFALGATGAVLALSSRAHAQPQPAAQPAVASQFSVFSHAQTSTDTMPARFSAMLQGGYGSAAPNVTDARRVTADDGQTAYLTPAEGGTGACVINTNEALCAPPNYLPGAATVDLCSPTLPAGELELEWLLPDGAKNVVLGMSNGAATPFASGYNVYIARLPLDTQSPVPSTIQWDDSAGQHHSVKSPVPSDAQTESCMHPGDPGSSAPSSG
jgi:hypothetical protein